MYLYTQSHFEISQFTKCSLKDTHTHSNEVSHHHALALIFATSSETTHPFRSAMRERALVLLGAKEDTGRERIPLGPCHGSAARPRVQGFSDHRRGGFCTCSTPSMRCTILHNKMGNMGNNCLHPLHAPFPVFFVQLFFM